MHFTAPRSGELRPGSVATRGASTRRLYGACVLSSLLFFLPASLPADGFGVYNHGARASGMGGAWVARVMDPSAVFYNPAGMGQLAGTQLYIGAMLVVNSGNGVSLFDASEFDREDETFLVPHVFLTHEINERLAAGVGVFAPYGLGSAWDRQDFPGRFHSFDALLRTIYVQPSASFAPHERFFIGGGVDLVYADVSLNREADLATLVLDPATGATFGRLTGLAPNSVGFLDSRLDAKGTGVGFNLGLLFKLSPAVQFGVNYRSQVEVDFEGDAEFTQLPTNIVLESGNPLEAPAGTPLDAVLQPLLPPDQEASATITLPDQLVGGVSLAPTERWIVNADLKWTNWNDFDTVVLDFQNENPGDEVITPAYKNSTSFRVGAEYFVSRAIALRGGYTRDESPVPERFVNPLLPDADRNEVSLGLGWMTGAWQIDGFWLLEFFEDRAGPVGADDEIPDGIYETTIHLFGLSLGRRL